MVINKNERKNYVQADYNTSGSQILSEGLFVSTSGSEGEKRGSEGGGLKVAWWSRWGGDRRGKEEFPTMR